MNGICNKDARDKIDENSFTSMPKLDVQCNIIDLVYYAYCDIFTFSKTNILIDVNQSLQVLVQIVNMILNTT